MLNRGRPRGTSRRFSTAAAAAAADLRIHPSARVRAILHAGGVVFLRACDDDGRSVFRRRCNTIGRSRNEKTKQQRRKKISGTRTAARRHGSGSFIYLHRVGAVLRGGGGVVKRRNAATNSILRTRRVLFDERTSSSSLVFTC